MSESIAPELHLFVIWSSALPLSDRMLTDMARHLEIVWKHEFPIEGRARDFYRRFYAHMRLDGKRKEKSCGKGPYLLVVVRDTAPVYVRAPNGIESNRTMLELKARYREWALRGYRVHGTLTREEFARDIKVLTGHAAAEWASGVPDGAIGPYLPPLASLPPVPGLFERIRLRRAQQKTCAKKRKRLSKRIRAAWWDVITSEGPALGLFDCRGMLENKFVNDIFFEGTFKGVPCIVKCSSRAPESIANEYEMSRRLAAADPGVCAEALAKWVSPDGRRAFVVLRKLPGPSLTDLLARGVDEVEAIELMEDMVRIAEALLKAGIVWRDIIPDNFMRDEEGHLRLIDAQFAIDRNDFHEQPFLIKHWTYRMLVFAYHPMMAGRGWNDVGMMLFCVWRLSNTPRALELCERLRSLTAAAAFPVSCGRSDRWRMRWKLLALRMCRLFAFSRNKSIALDTRIARAKAFLENDRESWAHVLHGHSHKGRHNG